jgi:hypothetical protein
MAKRLGANARLAKNSQKQVSKESRVKTFKTIGEKWRLVLVVVLVVATSAILGYGINRSDWVNALKSERKEYQVEWASVANQVWEEYETQNKTESEQIALLRKSDAWYQLKTDASYELWDQPLVKLPIIHASDGIQLEPIVTFLKDVKVKSNETFQMISEVSAANNEIDVIVEGIKPTVKLRLDRNPNKRLKLVLSFAKKFPSEISEAKVLDARFPGFIYASKGEG